MSINEIDLEYCDCCKEDLEGIDHTYCDNCGSTICNRCYSRYYDGKIFGRCPICQDDDKSNIVRRKNRKPKISLGKVNVNEIDLAEELELDENLRQAFPEENIGTPLLSNKDIVIGFNTGKSITVYLEKFYYKLGEKYYIYVDKDGNTYTINENFGTKAEIIVARKIVKINGEQYNS